jgi:hypothetical protein
LDMGRVNYRHLLTHGALVHLCLPWFRQPKRSEP